jgi:predicted dehydrogenase
LERIGVGIVGCGYWGINYVRVFGELPQTRVVVACDQQSDRMREVKRRFPGVAVTSDLADVLGNDEVRAVVIATPATTHRDVARAVLASGRHVLVEKPITTEPADAEDLIALAEERGRVLMVGHTFLYNPGIRRLKAYVDAGEVGRLYYLSARRTNLGPIRHDVNALWDLAPHDVAICNYLLGAMPEWVSAVGARVLRNSREDVGFISLGYQDGVIGHIEVSWAEPNKVREVVIVGSEKRVVFDDLNALERVRVFEKGVTPAPAEAPSYGELQFLIRDGAIVSPRVEPSEPLRVLCEHFADCVHTGKRPLTGGLEGLQVVQVMKAVDRSMAQRGAPVEISAPRQEA